MATTGCAGGRPPSDPMKGRSEKFTDRGRAVAFGDARALGDVG
jgi:hypothetical protein